MSNVKKSVKLVPGDPELLEIVKVAAAESLKRSSKSRSAAIKQLQRIGILTKSGRISSKYR